MQSETARTNWPAETTTVTIPALAWDLLPVVGGEDAPPAPSYDLNGIYVASESGTLTVAATDGMRLCVLDVDSEEPDDFGAIVPEHLFRAAGKPPPSGEWASLTLKTSGTLSLHPRPLGENESFATGNPIDGQFPAVRDLIPEPYGREPAARLGFNPHFMADAFEICAAMQRRHKTDAPAVLRAGPENRAARIDMVSGVVRLTYVIMPTRIRD